MPDQEVASYVAAHSDRLIGFLCLCMPGFEPNDKRLDYLYEYATRHALPVLLHTGTHVYRSGAFIL